MRHYLVTVLLSFHLISVHASTFLPTKIIDRMKNTDGSVEGKYIGKSYKKLPSGDVVTELVFKVNKVAGLAPNDILSRNAFKVMIPGGVWNNLTYSVSGVPTFKPGEEVVLMVRKSSFGYVLPDLTLSKFSVKRVAGVNKLESEVFSNLEGVGSISLKEFNDIARDVYGQELSSQESDKFVYVTPKKAKKSVKRSIASIGADDEEAALQEKKEQDFWHYLWLILGLGFVGALGKWVSRRARV